MRGWGGGRGGVFVGRVWMMRVCCVRCVVVGGWVMCSCLPLLSCQELWTMRSPPRPLDLDALLLGTQPELHLATASGSQACVSASRALGLNDPIRKWTTQESAQVRLFYLLLPVSYYLLYLVTGSATLKCPQRHLICVADEKDCYTCL